MMAKAVQKHLERFGLKLGSVEGVLVAADLALYINKANPIVRIVMRDTIGLFCDSLNQAEVVLSTGNINRIVDVLTEAVPDIQPVVELDPLPSNGEMSLSAGIPAPEVEKDQSNAVEQQPLKFGGESTPWNLMEDFSFDPGDEEEQIGEESPIPLVKPIMKKASRSRFSAIQWIVLVAGSVVVILLLVFIFRTLSGIL